MIVVPKPNPLNINRLGHHHSGYVHYPVSPVHHGSATPASSAMQRRAHKPSDLSLVSRTPPASPPRSPLNRHKHQYSNSRGNFTFGFPSPTLPYYPPTGTNSKHRHTKSGYAAPTKTSASNFFMSAGSQVGVGPEFEMALDFSDMSPPSSPSPSPSPSPTRAYRFPTPPQAPFPHLSHPLSFPSTPAPIPMRPTHSRAPSAPIFSHSPTSSSFERDRYANSTFQNSPPPAALPKPKFLEHDADVFN